MKVLEVKYLSEFTISVTFDDGVSGTIQLNDLVAKGIFWSGVFRASKIIAVKTTVAMADCLNSRFIIVVFSRDAKVESFSHCPLIIKLTLYLL